MDWLFLNVSFVGSNALAQELGADGVGVLVTQVVPFPEDDSLAVVAAYQRALAAYAPDATPGFVSFEGYLAGRLAIAGLEQCGPRRHPSAVPREPARVGPARYRGVFTPVRC